MTYWDFQAYYYGAEKMKMWPK